MERYLIALAVLAVALVLARILRERRSPAVAPSRDWHLPSHIDPADVGITDGRWAVVMFSSTTCETCRSVREAAAPLESDTVALVEVPYQTEKQLHDRYGIEAVPATVVMAPDGDVRAAWIGVIEPGVFWSTVSELTG